MGLNYFRRMKGEIVKLILQTIAENPENVYEALEKRGYSRVKAYSTVPQIKRWGYISQLSKSKYALTDKGKTKLNRFLYWISCPMCGSRVRLNGKRNGTGHQRYLCTNPNCHFTFTQTCKEEALMRALKKKKRVIFILHTSERFAYPTLEKLREWLKGGETSLDYLSKNVNI
jgi:transposase-like protein